MIDFDALEKQITEAFENKQVENAERLLFTNWKRFGFVQTAPNRRVYVDLVVASGIKMMRLIPAAIAKPTDEMVDGRDDFNDGYRVLVSKALNIPCNVTADYADPLAVQALVKLIISAAKAVEDFPLYDKDNLVIGKSTEKYINKHSRTVCSNCHKRQLAKCKLIVHWKSKLFCSMKCAKTYVKQYAPDDYINVDNDVKYILSEDLGMDKEVALERLTIGELVHYHPDKRMNIEEEL